VVAVRRRWRLGGPLLVVESGAHRIVRLAPAAVNVNSVRHKVERPTSS
jgi:hypothetical protein